jgi:hypothetical protein
LQRKNNFRACLPRIENRAAVRLHNAQFPAQRLRGSRRQFHSLTVETNATKGDDFRLWLSSGSAKLRAVAAGTVFHRSVTYLFRPIAIAPKAMSVKPLHGPPAPARAGLRRRPPYKCHRQIAGRRRNEFCDADDLSRGAHGETL